MVFFIKIVRSDDSDVKTVLNCDSLEELKEWIEYISKYPNVIRVEINPLD